MPQYMIECFYRDQEGRLGAVPRDRKRIVAADDDEAIKTCNVVSIRPELNRPGFVGGSNS
jgi:hypothetical protein